MLNKASLTICFVFALMAPALAGDPPVAAAAAPMTDGNVFFADKAGRHAMDPVCGMQVVVGDQTPTAIHDGKQYYFCSDGCGKAFSAKPAEYLGKMVLPAGVTAMSGNKMMANCAVSGERVAITEKTAHQVHNGKDYYFCCNKCPVAFAKNPDKYVKAMADAKPAPEAGKEAGHEDHGH